MEITYQSVAQFIVNQTTTTTTMKKLIITTILLMVVFTLCTDTRYHWIGCLFALVATIYVAPSLLHLLEDKID